MAEPSATCKGIAFEFPEKKRDEVVGYLKQREGRGFDLADQEIRLENGDRVTAIVAIYSGERLLNGKSLAELAAMARVADGLSGSCVDYVTNLAAKLAELGINDPVVRDFQRLIQRPA
jgi:cation transport regulator ChaC